MSPEFNAVGIGLAGGLAGILVILGVYISTMERGSSVITHRHVDGRTDEERDEVFLKLNTQNYNNLRAVHSDGGKRKTKRNKKSSKRV